MEVREYLWQLKNIDKRIEDKMEEAQRWRDIAENVTSKLNKDKVQTSPKPDKMADAITNAIQYERESQELARKLAEFKNKVSLMIDDIDDIRYYELLKKFFIFDMKYADIQSALDRSYRHVRRELDKAIEFFGNKYVDEIEKAEKIR
jgi:hypothetical protein